MQETWRICVCVLLFDFWNFKTFYNIKFVFSNFVFYSILVRRTLKGGLDIGDGLGTWRGRPIFLEIKDVWIDNRCNYWQVWKFFKENFFYVYFSRFHKKRTVCKRMRVHPNLSQECREFAAMTQRKSELVSSYFLMFLYVA